MRDANSTSGATKRPLTIRATLSLADTHWPHGPPLLSQGKFTIAMLRPREKAPTELRDRSRFPRLLAPLFPQWPKPSPAQTPHVGRPCERTLRLPLLRFRPLMLSQLPKKSANQARKSFAFSHLLLILPASFGKFAFGISCPFPFLPCTQLQLLFTPLSRFFSSFVHTTCLLSVFRPCLALWESYPTFSAQFPMNATLQLRPTPESSPNATQDSHLLWSSFPGEFRAQSNSLDALPKLQFGKSSSPIPILSFSIFTRRY